MSITQLEENKRISREFIAAINRQDLDTLSKILSPEVFAMMNEIFKSMDAVFSDHDLQIQEMIAEGDAVFVKLTSSGRHTGDFMGAPATNRTWEGNEGVNTYHFSNGVISDFWAIWNIPMHMEKLGIKMTFTPQ